MSRQTVIEGQDCKHLATRELHAWAFPERLPCLDRGFCRKCSGDKVVGAIRSLDPRKGRDGLFRGIAVESGAPGNGLEKGTVFGVGGCERYAMCFGCDHYGGRTETALKEHPGLAD